MRLRIYKIAIIVFLVLMIITNIWFNMYITIGNFTQGIDFLILIIIILTFALGLIQFDKIRIEKGSKHKNKYILFIMAIAITYFIFSNILTREYDISILIALICVEVILVLFVVYMWSVSFLILFEDGFVSSNMLKPKRIKICYSEIVDLKFNKITGYLVIRDNQEKASINMGLEGIPYFLNELTKNIDVKLYASAFENFAKFYKGLGMSNNLLFIDYFLRINDEECNKNIKS